MDSDTRAERMRRVARYKAVQAELARQKEEAEFDQRRARQKRAADVDAALAEELERQQRADLKDEKMLQLVRDYPEVRELEQKLRDAYLKQGRSAQLDALNVQREREAAEHREYLRQVAEQTRAAQEDEERKKAEEVKHFRAHQEAQLELIRQHREMALREAEERKKERLAVDAVVARVQEKEFIDALARRDKQRQLQEEQDEFYRIRGELKKAEREREAKEEAAIRAYLAEQQRRKETEEKLSKERDAVKERLLEEQSKRIAEEQRKKLELEALLHEYYEEERLAKEAALIQAEKESRERMSAAVTQENLHLIQARREARERELAEEMQLRQRMMEELAAQAKLQQLTKIRQMQLKKEHQAEVQARMDERQRQKEAEKALEKQVNEVDIKREEEIQEYIRRARQQLLEQHLPRLGEFAPVKALKPEEKRRFFPEANQ